MEKLIENIVTEPSILDKNLPNISTSVEPEESTANFKHGGKLKRFDKLKLS